MSNVKLSIVISAFNEEKKIEDCLKSASFADEIIFVDNTSSDKTLEMVKKYTSKIFVRENNLMLNVNKNFGFSKASGDWVLSLDADERITPGLAREIKSTIEQPNNRTIDGFWIPRKNIAFGKWIEHAGWYPDYQLRLFKRGKGKFEEKHVHEMIKVRGKTERLNSPLIHLNYESIGQFLDKMVRIYTPNEAMNLYKKGIRVKPYDAINYPLREFLTRYFSLEGYKDGLHGLVLSLFMAFYHFVIFALLWEKQGFKKQNLSLEQTEKEFKKSSKEIFYWIKREKVKNANLLKKLFLKLKR